MSKGVLAIFGQTTLASSESIRSFSNLYKIPFISLSHPVYTKNDIENQKISADFNDPVISDSSSISKENSTQNESKKSENFQINMHPDMVPLLVSLVKYNRWKSVYYIYNHAEG